MTKRYTGGVVSSAVPTVNAATASGVFLLSQQADAQAKNNWPPFKVEKSLRFRQAASAYLNRTPVVAGNLTTWTYSVWVKRGASPTNSGNYQSFMSYTPGGSNEDLLSFGALNDEKLYFYVYKSGYVGQLVTTQYFRDPSAWYHLVFVWDTTQATSSNRMKVYVNGVQVTAFATANYPSQNATSNINTAGLIYIGRYGNSNAYTDSYMAEANFIDGQALTPSSFGATDKDGNWSPIAYTGTYGQNGFYLNFKDATSTTTIGYDYSGNGNHWTSSGISVTAGATYDSMIDVPEDQSDGTANNRGNYCTINPLLYNAGSISYTNGNMTATMTAAADRFTIGNICASSGKFYWELTVSGLVQSNDFNAGICKQTQVANGPWVAAGGPNVILYNTNSGWNVYGATQGSSNGTISNGDTIGVAMDLDANNLYIYKNGALFQTLSSYQSNAIDTTVPHTFFFDSYRSGSVVELNCGQRPFAYTPPTGFKTLNTYNLPEPTIKQPNKHFDATLYTGNDTGQSVTNAGAFQPSLIWYKARSAAYYHTLEDDIRGAGTRLFSNLTDGESNDGIMTSFNTNGFTLGANSGEGINKNAVTYVAWQWKGATSNATNTSGSITSNVRANPAAGFSVVTYTGSGAAGTVGHGLGVAPAMIVTKKRTNSGGGSSATSWVVWHKAMSGAYSSTTAYAYMNTPSAAATTTVFYDGTAMTSSTFRWQTGNDNINYLNDRFVSYCWSEIDGYSKFGSYTGNGSEDGPFIYCGFKPKLILIKCISSDDGGNAEWLMYDTARNTYNVMNSRLWANSSASEYSYSGGSGGYNYDFVSNGFKVRTGNASYGSNTSGQTYIYVAFAEMPFKYARSR
jgi:hypothetical protein